jgi:hypothetical protein
MGNDYSMIFEADMTSDGIMLVFYLVYVLFMLAISVGTYVLQALSLYTIAKRRGIRNPWLSWIPVGNTWILGSISDQYQYVVKGKVRNKRKVLLVVDLVQYILASVLSIVGLAMLFTVVFAAMGPNFEPANEAVIQQLVMEQIGYFLLLLAAYLVVGALAIAAAVLRYFCLYDLYTSCDPRNSVLYLVLSIFVSVSLPILLFINRKRDDGMPPRKEQPIQPLEPWQEPQI